MFNADYSCIKLIDLGVSSKLDKTKATKAAQGGTPRYMPPEQLDGNLTFKVDIWSFACVLLEFGSGIRPYDQIDNDVALSMTIFRGLNPLDYAFGSSNADQFDMVTDNPDFKSILEACF